MQCRVMESNGEKWRLFESNYCAVRMGNVLQEKLFGRLFSTSLITTNRTESLALILMESSIVRAIKACFCKRLDRVPLYALNIIEITK